MLRRTFLKTLAGGIASVYLPSVNGVEPAQEILTETPKVNIIIPGLPAGDYQLSYYIRSEETDEWTCIVKHLKIEAGTIVEEFKDGDIVGNLSVRYMYPEKMPYPTILYEATISNGGMIVQSGSYLGYENEIKFFT